VSLVGRRRVRISVFSGGFSFCLVRLPCFKGFTICQTLFLEFSFFQQMSSSLRIDLGALGMSAEALDAFRQGRFGMPPLVDPPLVDCGFIPLLTATDSFTTTIV